MNKLELSLLAVTWIIGSGTNGQYVESFENGFTPGATAFQAPTGQSLFMTNDFRIVQLATFGANSSDWFIDTGALEGNDNMPPASILEADTSERFQVYSMDLWTSADDGNNEATGMVQITGGDHANTYTHEFTVAPTGLTGADWVHVEMAGTALEGVPLRSLTFTYSGGLNYLALDNLEYAVTDVQSVQDDPFQARLRSYPNPTSGSLTVDLRDNRSSFDLRVFNAQGALVCSHQFTNTSNFGIDLSGQATGPYTVLLRTADGETALLRVMKD